MSRTEGPPIPNAENGGAAAPAGKGRWINRSVVGICLATFFSDVSHEMCTAVLPLFLMTVGLGPAALGLIEGIADFLVSLSKLGGGFLGHHVARKKPWAATGYLITALATSAMGLVQGLYALVGLRALAWIGRGYRSPLRDYLLADVVAPTHYGRAYGLERAGDMLGAVLGPVIGALLIWGNIEFQTIILWTLLPGLFAAGAMAFIAKERHSEPAPAVGRRPALRFPRHFWLFLVGVFFFGLGDFSRTFLILLAASANGEQGATVGGAVSIAALLYALHNLTSAAAAYPVGHLGDRRPKLRVLIGGYALGVLTNAMLAATSSSLGWLVAAILLSGVYIAVEETLEKAAAAEFLPRELRSLGFGILATVNAVGDMVSSLYVGFLLEAQRAGLAFGLAAGCGAVGVAWLLWLTRRPAGSTAQGTAH